MAISLADFREMFPEFDTVSDVTAQFWIDFAACLACNDTFAECAADAAHGFLSAHYLKLALMRQEAVTTGGAPSGAVSSMSVGDVSRSWDTSQSANYASTLSKDAITAELALTDYGKIYLSLRRRLGFVALTTGMV